MALTEQEELELLELEAEAYRNAGGSPAPAGAPPADKPELSTLNTVRGTGQAVARGFLGGFGDELVAGARTLIDDILPDPGAQYLEGPDMVPNPGDDYAMYRADERQNLDQFTQENPVSSTALTIGGGIVSPLNKVAPMKGAGFLPRLLRNTGEGMLVGFGEGEGDAEDQFSSALTGGAFSAGTTAALQGLGGLARNTIFRRNIEPDLAQPDGKFKPINLAAPKSMAGNMYRNLVAKIPGANTRLAEQERPFVEEVGERLSRAKEAARQRRLNVDMKHNADTAAITDWATQRSRATATGLEELSDKIARQSSDQADYAARSFQAKAALEALPEHARNVLDDVDMGDAKAVANRIGKWWMGNGFDEVKSRSFEFDGALAKKIRERIAGDPELRLVFGDLMPKLQKMQGRLQDAVVPGKDMVPEDFIEEMLKSRKFMIDGDALMAMRNVFATGANGSSKNGYALRQIANEFDDFIRQNLDDPALVAQFDDQLKRYTTGLTFMDAARAGPTRKAGGLIAPETWMSAGKKFGGGGMSTKDIPLGDDVDRTFASVKSTSKEGAGKLTRAKRAKVKADRLAADKVRLRRALADKEKRQGVQAIQDMKAPGGELYEADTAVRDMQKMTGGKDSNSALSQFLAADFLARSTPGANRVPVQARLPVGIGIGNALMSPKAQLAVAGQTQLQQKANAALLRGDMQEYTRIVSRLGAQYGSGD